MYLESDVDKFKSGFKERGKLSWFNAKLCKSCWDFLTTFHLLYIT